LLPKTPKPLISPLINLFNKRKWAPHLVQQITLNRLEVSMKRN